MMFEDEVEESVDLLTVLKGSVSGSAAGNWGEAGSHPVNPPRGIRSKPLMAVQSTTIFIELYS